MQMLQAAARRHFAWLLALALWVPVAQWVAATHLLVHLQEALAAAEPEPDGLSACDTCVVAAALHAAAPPPATAPASPPPEARVLRLPATTADVAAATPLGYRSRAPPALA